MLGAYFSADLGNWLQGFKVFCKMIPWNYLPIESMHISDHVMWPISCEFPTLDSGIDVAPGINVAPLFHINLGIAVIFTFFLSSKIFKN